MEWWAVTGDAVTLFSKALARKALGRGNFNLMVLWGSRLVTGGRKMCEPAKVSCRGGGHLWDLSNLFFILFLGGFPIAGGLISLASILMSDALAPVTNFGGNSKY